MDGGSGKQSEMPPQAPYEADARFVPVVPVGVTPRGGLSSGRGSSKAPFGFMFLVKDSSKLAHGSRDVHADIDSDVGVAVPLSSNLLRQLVLQSLSPAEAKALPAHRLIALLSALSSLFPAALIPAFSALPAAYISHLLNHSPPSSELAALSTLLALHNASSLPACAVLYDLPSLSPASNPLLPLAAKVIFLGNGREPIANCDPVAVSAWLASTQTPLLLPKKLFQLAAVRIDVDRAPTACIFHADVSLISSSPSPPSSSSSSTTTFSSFLTGGTSRRTADAVEREQVSEKLPWELSAGELDAMDEEALRSVLRAAEIGSRVGAARSELQESVLEWMDEVERRRWNVQRAVDAQDFALASRLMESRSARHRARDELESALSEQRFGEASLWAAEVEWLDKQKADVTQDEGSYDPNLDQDPWYRPGRK